jgi:hypothetical protein
LNETPANRTLQLNYVVRNIFNSAEDDLADLRPDETIEAIHGVTNFKECLRTRSNMKEHKGRS